MRPVSGGAFSDRGTASDCRTWQPCGVGVVPVMTQYGLSPPMWEKTSCGLSARAMKGVVSVASGAPRCHGEVGTHSSPSATSDPAPVRRTENFGVFRTPCTGWK